MSLELAIKKARTNPVKKRGRNSFPRMATVLTDGYSYFVGTNSYRTSTLQSVFAKKAGQEDRLCTHSEISAIAKAVRRGKVTDFSKYKMYVARLLASGEPALAKPCEVCSLAIKEFGIKHVEYTE